MNDEIERDACFSDICMERCGGLCCDPWWGMVSYTVVKKGGGASGLDAFRASLKKGIEERAAKITSEYATREETPRPLFGAPERYNVVVRGIRREKGALTLRLLAMFAFRCRFLGPEKACGLHPSFSGGDDVRPPHCAYMGSAGARPGGKGYCRIIHAAEAGAGADADRDIETAIATEKAASDKYYGEGSASAAEAAERVVERLREYCAAEAAQPEARPGRNAPCPCGSGKKYKRCCGSSA